MWNTWVSWAIQAVPISWPIRRPPTRMIMSVIGSTRSTSYLRHYVSWTLGESLNRRDWTPRFAASIPGRWSWYRSWFASNPARRLTSSMICSSTFITRLCRTRRASHKITKVQIESSRIANISRRWNRSVNILFGWISETSRRFEKNYISDKLLKYLNLN